MTDEPLPNRRSFLKGESALDSVRKKADQIAKELPFGVDHELMNDRHSAYLEQYSHNAMACEFEVSFNLHQYRPSGAGAMAAFQLIDQLENQMSIYRDQSEVSCLNREAGLRPVVVEEGLYGLLKQAVEINESTHRAFDITAAQLGRVWGFESRQGMLPQASAIEEALECVGSEHLDFDDANRSLRIAKPGVSIDLGGIGKGFALDRAADLLATMQIGDFIFHGGQSSVVARGETTTAATSDSSEPDKSQSPGWTIGLSHPTLPNVRLAEVTLRNQAIGTSGIGRQGFFHDGKQYGHIIDPRTGWPANQFLSTTVISPSAALSDALATAFFVLNRDEVESYCESHPDVAAIIVSKNNRLPGQIELQRFNLPDDVWKQL